MKLLNVGILGLTKTAKIFAKQLLQASQEKGSFLKLVAMADSYAEPYKIEGAIWSDNEEQVIRAANVDIVIVCTEGLNNAFLQARTALEAGKHVVTNNQTLMAVHGQKLWRLAEDKAVNLRFEAALLGGVPIISSLFNSFCGSYITRVYGVLNGTCNYVLMRMKDTGCTLAEAISDATELNYTEEYSDHDISGKDSLYKLAILKAVAFGEWADITKTKITGIKGVEPIDIQFAQKFGCNIKLVASATADTISVAPTLVEEYSQLGNTNGTLTGVIVESDHAGPVFMAGQGNDKDAVASALMSDAVSISQGKRLFKMRPEAPAIIEDKLSRFYLRLPAEGRDKIVKAGHVRIIEEKYHESHNGSYIAYFVETGMKRHELAEFASGDDYVTSICVLNIER